jgi:hypothetical protein
MRLHIGVQRHAKYRFISVRRIVLLVRSLVLPGLYVHVGRLVGKQVQVACAEAEHSPPFFLLLRHLRVFVFDIAFLEDKQCD